MNLHDNTKSLSWKLCILLVSKFSLDEYEILLGTFRTTFLHDLCYDNTTYFYTNFNGQVQNIEKNVIKILVFCKTIWVINYIKIIHVSPNIVNRIMIVIFSCEE